MTSASEAAAPETAVAGKLGSPRPGTIAVNVVVVGLALLSALATFLVLANLTPIVPTHNVVVTLLAINAITVVFLLVIIARVVWQVSQARRHGRAGARLHVSIVGLFSIIAAAPAILVAVVASITLDRGLDRFFSNQTRALIQNSVVVADAYVKEHAQSLARETVGMAIDLSRAKALSEQDPDRYKQFFTAQATLRGMSGAMLLKQDRTEIQRADIRIDRQFILPPAAALAAVGDAEPQVTLLPDADYLSAMIKVGGYTDTVLYVTRLLDPRVVGQLAATQS